MFDRFGRYTLITTVFGYAVLISYTWPQGFIPLVSIQSLPILLLGFGVAVVGIFLFLGLLFLPFIFITDHEFLRDLLYGRDFDELEGQFKGRPVDISALALLQDVAAKKGWANTIFVASRAIVVFIVLPVLAWYFVALNTDNRLALIVLAPMMWFALRALVGLFKSRTVKDAATYLIGATLFFVILPTQFGPNLRIQSTTPNPVVRWALLRTGLGGGLPVLYHAEPTASELQGYDYGELVFYDGEKAWLTSCDSHIQLVNVVAIKKIEYLNEKRC